MKKIKKVSRYIPLALFGALGIIAAIATFLTQSQTAEPSKQGAITVQNLPIEYNADLAQLVATSVVIDASSVQTASLDLLGDDGKTDTYVAFYTFTSSDAYHGNKTYEGFRVYGGTPARLLFEDNASAWHSNPTDWNQVETGDVDGDGYKELIISGRQDGSGAAPHQIVLKSILTGYEILHESYREEDLLPTQREAFTDAERGISFVLPQGWTTGIDEGGNLSTYGQSPYSTVAFEIFTDKTEWTSAQENFSANMGTDLLVKEETLTVGGFPTTMRLYQRNTGGDSFFHYGKYYVDGGTRWYVLNTSDPSEDIAQIIESVRFSP